MPLKCLLGETPIFGFNYSIEEWERLKSENRKHKLLFMPCCHVRAIPKTSKLGTNFFAHAKAEGCETAAESAEHLLAKATIAEAAKLAGWTVDTEVRGVTVEGDTWVADVLAMKGQSKVAIEVQWSKQAQVETKRRQAKYAESGVRGLWLMRHPNLLVEQETPTFRLHFDESARTFFVQIPSPRYHPEFVGNHNKNEPSYWQQEIALSDFVVGALNGALKFAPVIGRRLPASISTAPISCWRCKKTTRIVHGVTFEACKVLPEHPNIYAALYDFESLDSGATLLAALFPSHLLRKHEIGAIKDRYSRTMGGSYLSNGCVHCDALQGRFYDHDSWYEAVPTYTVELELSKQSASHLVECESEAGHDIFRWWFDGLTVKGVGGG